MNISAGGEQSPEARRELPRYLIIDALERAHRRSEACLAGQKEAFRMAMNGHPLAESLEALLRTATEQIEGSPSGAFYLVKPDHKSLGHLTGMGETYAQDVEGFPVGVDSLACGLAMHRGEPIITRDVEEDPKWAPWRWMARKHGFRGCWSFPVRIEGGPILGALALHFSEPREPSDGDTELIGVLAYAASIIISRDNEVAERAQAQRALSAELAASSALHDVSTELMGVAEGSEREIYKRILDSAAAIMHADFASLQMLLPDDGHGVELRLLAAHGFTDETTQFWERIQVNSKTSCGMALSTGKRFMVQDVEAWPDIAGSDHLAMYLKAGIRATQTTPLISRSGKLLGMISTDWRVPHTPPERDLHLFDILARQAADLIERTQSIQALRDADRRKDEFLATLAHELRNPLAPIRYGARLARDAANPQQRLDALDVIERQTAHMARLLDDLLDIARITQGKLELRKTNIELSSVVSGAIESAHPIVDARHHTLTVSLPTHPVYMYADGVRVTQIFSNLLTNAAKYTDEGGRIELTAVEEGNEVIVSVRDNGIGIAPEVIPNLFLIFSQAKPALERADGGLGIGLALVRGLVELHGGAIEARSEGLTRGSAFIVRLPVGETEPAERSHNGKRLPASQPLRILVADDNTDNAELCAELLRMNGHEVHTAHSGRLAFEVAERMRPDVALLDIGMPEMNGYEVARRIRAEPWGAEMALVAITGWGQKSDRERASAAGFNQHLTKPVEFERLEEVVQSLRS